MNNTGKIMAAVFSTALLAAPFAARAQVSIDVGLAPPAPRYEAVPPPRAGFVWAPGHWGWNGAWVWGPGRWVAARPGYRWAPGAWVHRGPRWHYVEGHWVG
jgi:WXXGXW repeat (2 copies)